MNAATNTIDGPADAELISAVRGGDTEAYGALYSRHVEAARRLARQLVSAGDVDDLVSEAFAKVMVVLQRGGGPDVAFRAYLLTAIRRLHVDRIRATSRLQTTDDLTPFDPGVPFVDTAVEGFESGAAAQAFASLPERWQLVLWHLEVEGQKPADIAPLLGMSANSVSALAYRAREGLRQAFLTMHVQELDEDTCRWTHQHLGAYVRKGLSRRDVTKVENHLGECRKCMAIYLELTEVNSNLAGILAPLLLGSFGAAYLATASGAAAKGILAGLLDRGRDLLNASGPGTAIAGVALVAALGAATVAGSMALNRDDNPAAGDQPPGVAAPSAPGFRATGDPGDNNGGDRPGGADATDVTEPADSAAAAESDSTDAVDPAAPADPGDSTDSAQPGDPTNPPGSTPQPTDPTDQPTSSTDRPTSSDPESSEPTRSPTEPTRSTSTADTSGPATSSAPAPTTGALPTFGPSIPVSEPTGPSAGPSTSTPTGTTSTGSTSSPTGPPPCPLRALETRPSSIGCPR